MCWARLSPKNWIFYDVCGFSSLEYTGKNAATPADINTTRDTDSENLDGEMNDILSSKQLNDEEKAKLYDQVLQRYRLITISEKANHFTWN